MKLVWQLVKQKWQHTIYVALSLLSLIFAIVLDFFPGAYFQKYFAGIDPIAVIAIASVMGMAALWMLQLNYGFVILKRGKTIRGISLAAVLATALAAAIVIADFIFPYPQDINVPLPQALLFYPAIGFVVEIIFHLIPLALLLFILKPLAIYIGKARVIWIGILLVAVIEPAFQVLFQERAFMLSDIYTWVHIFVINLLQLYVFWRFDFVSMFVFRMSYYLYWHILWGTVRLDVLF